MTGTATPRRGEVWLAGFDPVVGREQGGSRPALVLSPDAFNDVPGGLVALVPITAHDRGWRVHDRVVPPEGGLDRPSVIMCEQLKFLSQLRLKRRIGEVEATTIRSVERIVHRLLGF